MNKLFKIFLVTTFSTLATGAFAQSNDGKVRVKVNYNIGIPTGSFKSNYINKSSFNGGSGEISYWFNPRAAAGLSVGYQSYLQKNPRQTYKLEGNQSISAVLTNTVEVMPVLINGTFAPLATTGNVIQPYVSGGAGINMVSYSQYFGEFPNSSSSASFAAQAGAGVMVSLGTRLNNAAFQVGGTYNYMPYNKNGLKSLSNIGVNAGVVFPLR